MTRLFVMCAVVGTGAGADILNVPGDFETIQAAIDARSDGDEIVVAPGTYNEALNINVGGGYGVDITIQADTGQTPIIDGNGVTGAGGIRNGPLNDGSTSPSTTTLIGIRFKRWGSTYGVFRADYGTGDDKIIEIIADNSFLSPMPFAPETTSL